MSTIEVKNIKLSNGRKFEAKIERYNSAADVVNDCRIRKHNDERWEDIKSVVDNRKDSWYGVDSFDEALELLRTGYQPVVEKLQTALKISSGKGTQKRIQFENNVHGFAPVVPLAMKGVPNSMINMTMKPIKTKVIDVYYLINCGSMATSQEIIENGQKLLGIIIELEKMGYRFNLYALQTYTTSSEGDILCVKVKSSDKPLDLKRMSFPLTHPAFIRCIGFDWQSKSPITTYRGSRGASLAFNMEREEVEEFGRKAFGDNARIITAVSIRRKGDEYIKEVLTNGSGNNRSKD